MAIKRGPVGKERGFAAAMRRFPESEFAIRKMMANSEAFCDMCEELADADFALARVVEAPPDIREARRAEWEELVEVLSAEVKAAIG
jgi:hypothetical protein